MKDKQVFLKKGGVFYSWSQVTGFPPIPSNDDKVLEDAAKTAMDIDPDIEAYEIREDGIRVVGKRTLQRNADTVNPILMRSILDDIRKKIESSCEPFTRRALTKNEISELATLSKKGILWKLKALGVSFMPIIYVIHSGEEVGAEDEENFRVRYSHPKTGQILKGEDLHDFLGIPDFAVYDITLSPKEDGVEDTDIPVAISSDEESDE